MLIYVCCTSIRFLLCCPVRIICVCVFFFNETATTEIYTYLHLFPYTTLFRPSIQESSGSVLRSFGRSARVPANLRGISMKILNKIAVAAICSAFAAQAPASAQEYYARHKLEVPSGPQGPAAAWETGAWGSWSTTCSDAARSEEHTSELQS